MVAPFQFNPNLVPNPAINIGIPIPWDPNATTVNAGGADVSLTFTPTDPDKFVEIGQIEVSYATAPTNGGVTITDGGTTVWQIDISAAGPQFIQFLQPRAARVKGNSIVVTLKGGTVVAKLNVHAWARI